MRCVLAWVVAAALAVVVGCERPAEAPAPAEGSAEAPTNRVDINAMVRQNLGITFARVERRHVARMLRVAGRFELTPNARREYRAPAEGRVEVLVEQYARVEAGMPLYVLDSPAWREMQRELSEAEAAAALAAARADSIGPLLEAHEAHHVEIQSAVDLWAERVAALERMQEAGGARAEDVAQARASLASARADLAETLEKEAELEARRRESEAQVEAARSRLQFLYESAAALTGVSAEALTAPGEDGGPPMWRTIGAIEVRALATGIVDSVLAVSGGLVEEHAPVVVTVQPERVRFRAVALQSDLPRLADGQAGAVVAAQPGANGAAFEGAVRLAPTADPERRTVELVLEALEGSAPPAWARAGVSAFLEVVTGGTGAQELAIPLRCVARDGTAAIIFRRDPGDPERAIRMEADLGIDDGRWVVVRSGVAEGNEVVLDGVYQLMVATSGSITKGGHFHPDGTFHEGED
jgi:hypothetical protein